MKHNIKLFGACLLTIGALGLVGCGATNTDTVSNTAEESVTQESRDNDSFAGSYQDVTSQRATMDITTNEDGTYHMVVTWSSSATENDQWIMDASLSGDTLSYSNCEHDRNTWDEDGYQTIEILTENGSGSFAVADGELAWTDDTDSSVNECIFEKAE